MITAGGCSANQETKTKTKTKTMTKTLVKMKCMRSKPLSTAAGGRSANRETVETGVNGISTPHLRSLNNYCYFLVFVIHYYFNYFFHVRNLSKWNQHSASAIIVVIIILDHFD